jgi:hypothetical protein
MKSCFYLLAVLVAVNLLGLAELSEAKVSNEQIAMCLGCGEPDPDLCVVIEGGKPIPMPSCAEFCFRGITEKTRTDCESHKASQSAFRKLQLHVQSIEGL